MNIDNLTVVLKAEKGLSLNDLISNSIEAVYYQAIKGNNILSFKVDDILFDLDTDEKFDIIKVKLTIGTLYSEETN